MSRSFAWVLLAALMVLVAGMPISAQESSPRPSAASSVAPPTWPSGDALRRELQEIGFAFRVARASGDWQGWAPRATIVEAPALTLGGNGSDPATASFSFDLLETDLLGTEVDGALTALMEVASRLPLDPGDAERARRFVVADLLTEPPEVLEPCYARTGPGGAILILVDAETGRATLRLAPGSEALDVDDGLEIDACRPIAASVDGPPAGTPSSERLTVGTTDGSDGTGPAFDPAEPALEGSLVTVVLTFRNNSSALQSLTFEAPLQADTGSVLPGDVRLIVVRQLEPGDYPFYSSSDPEGMRGVLRISAAPEE